MKTKRVKAVAYDSVSASLRAEWEELWNGSDRASIFNSPEWFLIAAKTFHPKARWKIIAIRDTSTQKLKALVALVKINLYGVLVYSLPGGEFVDRFMLLADSDATDAIELLSRVFPRVGAVYIPGLVESDTQLLTQRGVRSTFFPTDVNPFIPFRDGHFGDLPARRKSKSFGRAERAFGLVRAEMILCDHADALRTAFAIDQASSRQYKGKGVFTRKDARDFFLRLAEEKPESLFVELLSFGEKPVAYSIGFRCDGVYACSQKAHLKEYDRYRPGGIAFAQFLEILVPEALKEVDLGRGYDQFKMDFTKTVRQLYGVIYSRYVLVRLYVKFAHGFRGQLYRWVNRFPRVYSLYKAVWFGGWSF